MLRSSLSPDQHYSDDDEAAATTTSNAAINNNSSGFHSIRDRFRFKRNPNPNLNSPLPRSSKTTTSPPDRWKHGGARSSHQYSRFVTRRFLLSPFRGRSWFYFCVFFVIFVFALASMVLQSSVMSVLRLGGSERLHRKGFVREDLKLGSSLEFVPQRRFASGGGLDLLRSQPRIGVRPPRIGVILGNMKKDPKALMLYTVVKNLQRLGYLFKVYAVDDGNARSIWEDIGGQISILSPDRYGYIDWSTFEGVIADSLEAKDAISRLMLDPYCSVPLIWIIQEETLANRLEFYEKAGWGHLISHWKQAFRRADVVVFPDFSFPMLYSVLDAGNFFVIPGSPIDVWAAESYAEVHIKSQLREENGFDKDDLVVLVVGGPVFYSELSWDYAMAMAAIEPLLIKYAGGEDAEETLKFVFMCGNSSTLYKDALQDTVRRLGLQDGYLRHFGLESDVNGLLAMADVVLYGSSQNEQGFPPLLMRAMSFGLPVISSDNPFIKKYVVDGVDALTYPKNNPTALVKAFSLLISNRKLSEFAHSVASFGRLRAKNMLAAECVTNYAQLLGNIFNFPSDVLLPAHASQLKELSWEWSFLPKELEQKSDDFVNPRSVVYDLEEDMTSLIPSKNVSEDDAEVLEEDIPTESDWEILREMENLEETESLETEEIEERMEKDIGEWDDIYRNARKAEKLRFESNERDEGELERTGQSICIYEIYGGAGAWPFLHHGSLYRGLSLSTRARRLKSDDVDAVDRLPLLNDTFYQNIICEIGGMFSIANKIDNIHKRPWIGFQSWHAAGRKVSLSGKAEEALEEAIQSKTKGDVIYFWARLDVDGGLMGKSDVLTFWSMCDILNGGNCRTAFEDAFRRMYGLPSHVEALPPMPEDGGYWSALHSWVIPTPSFLEFIMFSRIFVDSLHGLHTTSSKTSYCLLGVSALEKKHCYCRVLDILVNVWAYHSARKIVYVDPHSGFLEEQHPVEHRKGYMWSKYFNITVLKSMDEDLAEAADDRDHPYENWLWPLTGEVYWQGIYEREREERYRLKMDKKRKTKEKLVERMKFGYKQKTLGG